MHQRMWKMWFALNNARSFVFLYHHILLFKTTHTHVLTHKRVLPECKHTLKLGLCIITNTRERATVNVAESIKPATRESFCVERCSWLNSFFRFWISTITGTHTQHPPHIQSSIHFSHTEHIHYLFIHHLSCVLRVGYSLSSCAWHESLLSSFSSAWPHPWIWESCLWMQAAVAG